MLLTTIATFAALAGPAAPLALQTQDPPPVERDKPVTHTQEDFDDLQFRVETLEMALDRMRRESAVPPPSSNSFNPQITVFGNFLGRGDNQPVHLDDDPAEGRIDDTLNLREIELDFRAAIDPWADGVLILSSEAELPGEYSTGVEEGYLTLKRLPILDAAPGGLKLKAGRFRAGFGRFNKVHLHDLPWVDYPRSLGNFLGPEGYIQNGVSGQFFLPSPSESSTLEATVEYLGGGELPLAADLEARNPAGVGHLAWFQELSQEHTLDLGASYWTSQGDRELLGADATYKWKPFSGGAWHSFLLGGEVFGANSSEPGYDNALGWYLWTQYQFTRNTYLGLRFDDAEELSDASLSTRTTSLFLTYYTSEFLRFRLGASQAVSDLPEIDGRTTAFVELNMVFGSHPVEPHWVNR